MSSVPLLHASSIQTSDNLRNNFEINRTLTKGAPVSQPTTFITSEADVQQEHSYMKPRGILRKASIEVYLTV